MRSPLARTVSSKLSKAMSIWIISTIGGVGVVAAKEPKKEIISIQKCESADGLFTLYTPYKKSSLHADSGQFVDNPFFPVSISLSQTMKAALGLNQSLDSYLEGGKDYEQRGRLWREAISLRGGNYQMSSRLLKVYRENLISNAEYNNPLLQQRITNQLKENNNSVDQNWCEVGARFVRMEIVRSLERILEQQEKSCSKIVSVLDDKIGALSQAAVQLKQQSQAIKQYGLDKSDQKLLRNDIVLKLESNQFDQRKLMMEKAHILKLAEKISATQDKCIDMKFNAKMSTQVELKEIAESVEGQNVDIKNAAFSGRLSE